VASQKEEEMDNDEMEDNEDQRIDVEEFLQGLLAVSGDEATRLRTVEQVAKRANLPPDKVEELMKVLIELLMNSSRSN
jgi:hypothetical protein